MVTPAPDRFLDVSDLEPCEPMERALQASADLSEGQYLHLLHRREPHLLYPILAERGFCWRTVADSETRFHVYIWRQGDQSAEQHAQNARHAD